MGLSGLRHAIAHRRSRAPSWRPARYRLLRFVVPELWRVPLLLGMDDGKLDGRSGRRRRSPTIRR